MEKAKNQIPDYEVLFYENSGEEKGSKLSGVLKMLLRENIWSIFISTIFYIIKALPIWVIPIVTADVINIITNPDGNTVNSLILYGVVLGILLLQNIPTHVLYSRFTDRMLRTVGAGMRNTLVKKLQHLSISYHKEIETGRIQSKFLRDIEAIEFLNTHFIKTVIPLLLNIIISVAIAISKSGAVTLFFFIVVPVNVAVVYFFRHHMRATNKKFRRETENISARMSTMLDMIPVTKAHGLEDEEIKVLEENIIELRRKGLSLDRVNAYFGSVTWVISQSMSAICLFFTGFLALKGKIQVGDVVLYQTYFNMISNSIQNLLGIYPELAKGLESVRSVSEVVLSDKTEDNTNKIKLRCVCGGVEFKNASYRYPNTEEDTVKNLSLRVEPGECVAFVGASGSGKTTIMNMIIGFLPATDGEVLIDGKPMYELNLSEYRKFLSVVPQNSILFTGSIKDNITYGLTDVSEEKLSEVVKMANINEFADTLPNGLDTMIGEGGEKLSGGQKQRISIARALIRNPKILILDEATSALDNISEYHVQKAISHLVKDRTTFIVAHRLTTIRNADRIVVIDGGRCVEMGTYDELMAKKGKFFELKTLNDMNTKED